MNGMERIDLELYADRLATHASRLTDDLSAARLRVSWREIEAAARARLTADDLRALEAVGVIEPVTVHDDDDRLAERRRAQLDALLRLQQLVEELRDAQRRGR
jgi:hypothetical protein